MDHLPNPRDARLSIHVPYLGGEQYDNLGFEGYPKRKGWTAERLSSLLKPPDGKTGEAGYVDALAFVQSWLFFGTLSHVLGLNGIEIKKGDYTRQDDGGNEGAVLLITTDRLPYHVAQYLEVDKLLPEDIRIRRERSVVEFLIQVCRQAWTLDSAEGKTSNDGLGPIILSVTILCTSLSCLLYRSPFVSTGANFLRCLMVREGWCPRQAAMINEVFSESTVYYIYTLGPPKLDKDHARCSRAMCEADQIDEATYRTVHQSPDCQCEWAEASPNQTAPICEAGGIPLVSIVVPTGEDVSLHYEVEQARPGALYIAISHVWSDGLGNPRTNALPECQMRTLISRAWALLSPEDRALSGGKVRLWIDTLCVPLRPDRARRAAIATMRRTYAEAASVLVLDSELAHTRLPPSALETRIRVVTSAWFSRLWTFQEGVLARSLYFQFQDGVINGHALFEAEKLVEGETSTRGYTPENLVFTYPRSVIFEPGVVNPRDGLLNVFEGLRWRATTKAKDEAICLATLLQIDLPWVMSFPEDDRFKAVLKTQCHFRLGMIFFNGPRMEDYGYRWAPRSFMTGGDPIPFGITPAYFTQFESLSGLCFESVGLAFGPGTIPAHTTKFTLRLASENDHQLLHVLCYGDSSWNFLEELNKSNEPAELALIPGGVLLGLVSDATPRVVQGVLVVLLRKEQFIWFGRFVCCVRMTRFPAGFQLLEGVKTGGGSETVLDISNMGEAAIRPHGGWCIG